MNVYVYDCVAGPTLASANLANRLLDHLQPHSLADTSIGMYEIIRFASRVSTIGFY